MNYEKPSKDLSLIDQIFDPTSDLYLDNLLDLATSISYDIHCSGTWKNSKPIKAFLDRYSNFADKIYHSRVSLNDFNIIKTVGQGGFGRVDLVRHKQTQNIYAMKVMDKSTFVQNSFNGFWEERDIMAKNASDWLIKCFYTFMDLRKLYIVMEYMPGGDLYHWMGILEDFSEEQTHFYAMEMVLAVEVLHNMGFLHRDLKPDNMLLDKNGHLKLADFGTCIRVQNGRVKTNFQVGTPDYICPEILRNPCIHDLEVGFEIDWWAFGIVIYELFYGETPFEGESTSTLYQNIMCYQKTLIYPDDKPASAVFIDFLSRILTEPTERMSIAHIKQHPYLTGATDQFPWSFDTIRDHQSPVLVTVSGDDDTAHISLDTADRRNNIASLFTNNNYFSGENLAFSGFTFNRDGRYCLPVAVTGASSAGNDQNNRFELAELELVKQQLSVKLESTTNELTKTQVVLGKLEKEMAEKEQLMSEKKSDYLATLETNKQLRSKLDSVAKHNESIQREIDQVKAAIAEKEALTRTMKIENGNMVDEVALLQGQLQSREDKICQLGGALEERQSQLDAMKRVDEQWQQEKTRNQNMMNELSAKNRKINEYELQLEETSRNMKPNEINSGQTDNDELERLMKEKQMVEVRLNRLTAEFNDADRLRNELQTEMATEKQKRLEAEKMRDKLAKDVSNQKMVVASLQNKFNTSEDQKRVLKQKINVIESEKDQIEQQKKMFESMVEVRKAENDGMTAELEEAEELFEKKEREFECERDMIQAKLTALVSQLEDSKADVGEKTRKLEQFKLVMLENDHLSQQIDKYKQELEERKQEFVELSRITLSQRTELDKNEKQMVNDKAKIVSLVSKIDEMVKNPKSMQHLGAAGRNKKKESGVNTDLLRRIKLLESDFNKEKMKFQDKCRECHEARNECQNWQDQNKELKSQLDSNDITIKELRANINGLMMVQKTALSTADPSKSAVELKSLEGRIEILKKGKGRHKILWSPSFGSLKPFKLDIFPNEGDNIPTVTIDMRSVIHIREPSAAECVHIDKALLPQILQIIYEKQEIAEETRRLSMISGGLSRHQLKSSTLSIDDPGSMSINASMRSSSMMADVVAPSNGIYNIENHSFVPMRFRAYTNCDICHQSCSDLLNPPAALECGNCKKRIHFDHISSNDQKIQWCQGAIEVIIFKVESKEAKFAWLNSLNQFKEYQKTNEIQVAPNTFYRSIRQPSSYSPGNLSIP